MIGPITHRAELAACLLSSCLAAGCSTAPVADKPVAPTGTITASTIAASTIAADASPAEPEAPPLHTSEDMEPILSIPTDVIHAVQRQKVAVSTCIQGADIVAPQLRCACRALCVMQLPASDAGQVTRVSYPLSSAKRGLHFEIAANGRVHSCGYEGVIETIDCDAPRPSAHALRAKKIELLDPTSSIALLGPLRIDANKKLLSHMHGGSAAWLSEVAFTVSLDAPPAQKLRVRNAWLMGAHCMAKQWSSAEELKLGAVVQDGLPAQQATALLSVRPKSKTEIVLRFGQKQVYNACDSFAVRVGLEIDGKPLEMDLPVEVTRWEPDFQ